VEPLLGVGSLILLSGEQHRRERRLLSAPFRGSCSRSHAESIFELTLETLSEFRVNTRVRAQELTRRITLRVIIEVVFGIRQGSRRALFERAIDTMLASYVAPLMIVPGLRRSFKGITPWDRFVRTRTHFRSLLHEELRARRISASLGHDVLSSLLTLRYEDGSAPSDAHLVDELCTLLVAGHDTTAIALAWALYYVHHTPRVHRRLMAELHSLGPRPEAAALLHAPYLRAVCDEALRIHPVVPISARRLRGALRVCGRELGPGQSVAVALTLLHRNPAIFANPGEFTPERFLEARHTPFQYAPFGGGARRCVGASFASSEMQVVLGALLSRASFAGITRTRPRAQLHGITMGPVDPVLLSRTA
jgi:cytochrome P450